jgi:biopolymer transport protein ExbD
MARKPSDRSHGQGEEEPGDVSLVPIMAIMVILIPMLIYMFTFHTIKVQRVMAPRRGTGAKKASEDKKEKELNLTIMIKREKGFQLSWEEQLMTETQNAPLLPMRQAKDVHCGDPNSDKDERVQGCNRRAEGCYCYDFAGLYNELVKIKTGLKTPEGGKPEKRVNITADLDVPWEVVSRTMDASTCMMEQPSYVDFEDFRKAEFKPGDKVKIPGVDDPLELCEELFPNVVFAMAE